MKYEITRRILGCRQSIDLSPERFQLVTTAKFGLLGVLSIEEKLDLLIEDYREFELELHRLTLDEMLYGDRDWSSFVGGAHKLNRHIANLLSACRLYVDQTKHQVSELFGRESEHCRRLRESLSAEYDDHLGYRALEELRNVVQHRSLPIALLSYTGAVDDSGAIGLIKNTCTPSLDLDHLQEQGFKSKLLAELRHAGIVDLKPLIREYVASIGRIHNRLREDLRPFVTEWEEHLDGIEQEFRARFGEDTVGLAVVCSTDEGETVESADVIEGFRKRRRQLEQKNHDFSRLRTQFISSEVVTDKKDRRRTLSQQATDAPRA